MNAKKIYLRALTKARDPVDAEPINYTVRPRSDFDVVNLHDVLGWLSGRYNETRELRALWRSHAVWPQSDHGFLVDSTDLHESEEAARAVCRMLRRDGLGGEGRVFPTRVWYERIDL